MNAFHVPAELYKPLPQGVKRPDSRADRTRPHDYWIGWDIWEDDGGLLQKDFRLGSTITLTDHYGLKSIIQVDRRADDGPGLVSCDLCYAGTGTIEGYTSSRQREIKIFIRHNRIYCLYCRRDSDDFGSDLWKEYDEFMQSANEVFSGITDAIIREFTR